MTVVVVELSLPAWYYPLAFLLSVAWLLLRHTNDIAILVGLLDKFHANAMGMRHGYPPVEDKSEAQENTPAKFTAWRQWWRRTR